MNAPPRRCATPRAPPEIRKGFCIRTVLRSCTRWRLSQDGFGLSSADSALLVVPMFHVNAWGMPYAAAMCGAKLVLPGAALDGESLYQLMR